MIMDNFGHYLGGLIVLYATIMLILRLKKPDSLAKLERMKRFFGNILGSTIHMIFYIIFPYLLGLAMIYVEFDK